MDNPLHFLERNASGPTVPHAVQEHATHDQLEGVSLRFLAGRKEKLALSYEEVYDEMIKRGAGLLALGFKKGDKVAFILPNPDDFVLTFLGALAVGVVPVPMYPPLSLGKLDTYMESAGRILEASESVAILTDNKMKSVLWSLVDRAENVRAFHTVDALLAADASAHTVDLDLIDQDDVAFLQFTSGSTSTPKGVIVTHRSLLANLDGIMNVGLEINPDDVAVSWLPLYHDMGLIGFMLAPVWYAVPTVYIPTLDFVKHPARWMEAMNTYRGSIAFAPNFAFALAARRTKPEKMAGWDLSCVKVLGCGAEPNHPATLRNFVEHFEPAGLKPQSLLPCYGMAEATLAITFVGLEEELKTDIVQADVYQSEGRALPLEDEDATHGLEFVSCGRPFPEHDVLIVDKDLNELPERTVGQVVVRGPSVTPGYFREKEKTAEVFTNDGLLTGDLGYIADGELYVTGRMKDVIILNGRNYDPQSIEWIVQEIDGIRKGNVVAFSKPGEQSESLVVVAEVKDEINRDELKALVRETVRSQLFLGADDVFLVGRGELPKTSSGKLQRRKTRDQYLDGSLGEEGVRSFSTRGDRLTLAKHITLSAISQVRHRVRDRASRLINRFTN